ncbi:MerR family transcriptional regulator [Brevibacillus daliensis]|uniref:MerR family transcriptional regulator n=1 Tax=Brevibacillus daliensis TaxID=2892995 RepID=UPI001E55C391|nr:MerR family transcriptional regulator [Brevibacillus daliensis]
MAYKVKELAELAGISVRTLHHYDQIELLQPDSITPAGYRLYSDNNLITLQQILFFKEIGFTLDEIKTIITHPDFDRKKALHNQKELLQKKKNRLEKMIEIVDLTLDSYEGEYMMEKKKMFDGFDMSEIEKYRHEYAEEAKERYGKEIIEETHKRTDAYSPNDWATIMEQQNAIYQTIAENMDKGPSHPLVQQAVGEWREHITKHYYECTLEIFRGLGDMYVADERFTQNINKVKPGLAAFLRDAMHIYCDNHA